MPHLIISTPPYSLHIHLSAITPNPNTLLASPLTSSLLYYYPNLLLSLNIHHNSNTHSHLIYHPFISSYYPNNPYSHTSYLPSCTNPTLYPPPPLASPVNPSNHLDYDIYMSLLHSLSFLLLEHNTNLLNDFHPFSYTNSKIFLL